VGWDLHCSAHEKDLEGRYPSDSQRRRIVQGVLSPTDSFLNLLHQLDLLLAVSSYAEAFGETGVGFRWLLVGNATDTRGSLRTRLLILHWIGYDASARPLVSRMH
jgi:hypothetical protein